MGDALWPCADDFRAWHTSRRNAGQSFFWLSNEFHEANCPLTFQGTTETLLQLFDAEAETPYPVSQYPHLNDDFVCWLQLPSDVVGTEWYFGAVTFDRRRHRRKLFDDFRVLAAKCGACLRQNPRFREWLWPCMQYLTQADRHPNLRKTEEIENIAWWVALLFTKPNFCGLLHEACTRHDITALEIARFQIDNPAHWSKVAILSHRLSGDPFWPMVGCRVALPFRDIPCPDFIERQSETDSDTGRSQNPRPPATEADSSDNRNATVAAQTMTRRRTINKRGRRGRPKVDEAEAKNRRERVANWKRWKTGRPEVRNPMQRYCADETAVGRAIDPPTLKRYVNWVTVNRTRKAQKRG